MRRFATFLLALATISSAGADDTKKEAQPAPALTADEEAVIALTNAERKTAELLPLKPNPRLMEAARKHAENMAKQDKLEHVLDDKAPSDRVKAAGYAFGLVGENIAWNPKTAKEAVAEWIGSKPHRANILGDGYTDIGVAVAKNTKGELYWVQVFGKPSE